MGNENTAFRQAIAVIESMGSTIGPVIVKPFLILVLKGHEKEAVVPSHHLLWPFLIVAILFVISAAFMLIVWWFYPETDDHPSRLEASEAAAANTDPEHETMWQTIKIALVIAFILMIMTMSIAMKNYLKVYTDGVGAGEFGPGLSSSLFAAQTVARVAGHVYLPVIGIEMNYLFSFILFFAAKIILLTSSYDPYPMLTSDIIFYGISTANDAVPTYSYMEKYFKLSSKIASIMGVISMIGSVVSPLILGDVMEPHPTGLFWCLLFLTVMAVFFLISFLTVSRMKLSKSFNLML